MQFDNNFIDLIKQRVSITDIVSKTVALQNRGNKLLGLCPFHQEKTPSFSVNEEKGFYYCFGCNASGDIFSFLANTENMEFEDAVKYLAQISGLKMPERNSNPAYSDHLSLMKQALLLAKNWFKDQLNKSHGYNILQYLNTRKVNQDSIIKFEIGFAPNSQLGLYNYLVSCNVKPDIMLAAGLVIKKDNGGYIDKFRDRIIFPIFNDKGEVIAFGGRSMGDKMPKYLNSPETQLFKKSEVLYGYHLAKKHVLKQNQIIVVEGYMDTIILAQYGFEAVVASLGTAFSAHHLLKLWKICKDPVICLDGDLAGANAMNKIAQLAINHLLEGKTLNFIILPDGNDPDDILKKSGADHFSSLLAKAKPLSEILWSIIIQKNNLHISSQFKTPEIISNIENDCLESIKNISSNILRKNYESFFKQKIWQIKKNTNYVSNNISQPKFIINDLDKFSRYQYSLLSYIMTHPYLVNENKIQEEFLSIDFLSANFNAIRAIILDHHDEFKNDDSYKEKLVSLLRINNLYEEYDLLCGKNSEFADNISTFSKDYCIMVWELLYQKYYYVLLEIEYQEQLTAIDNTEKLFALQKELQMQQEYINNLEAKLHDQ
jgi:DNA primase